MKRGLTGGCLCGGVRYECAAEPMLQGHCQCRDCQKGTGTGHSSHFGMPAGALKLSGELRAYETTADSGRVATRAFCPNCGSPILFRTSALPDVVFLTAGSLDDPALLNRAWSYLQRPRRPGIPSIPGCKASRECRRPENALSGRRGGRLSRAAPRYLDRRSSRRGCPSRKAAPAVVSRTPRRTRPR